MKKKIRIIIIVCFLTVFNSVSYAQIKKTYSVNSSSMQDLIEFADKDTIVFITLDDVLLRPDYTMFSNNSNPYRDFVNHLINLSKESNHYYELLANWYIQQKLTLIEQEWVEVIQKFKDKGAMVFGICEMPIYIKDIENKRYEETLKLGIKFTESINIRLLSKPASDSQVLGTYGTENRSVLDVREDLSTGVTTQLTSEVEFQKKSNSLIELYSLDEWKTIFYQGIIFTASLYPHQAIEDFMKITHNVPKKTIFFGFDKRKIVQIDKMLRPFDMDFFAVEYLALVNYKPQIDIDKIRFQQLYFIENSKLLNDSEVDSMMQKKQELDAQKNSR